jgi:cell division protein FtsB
MAEPSKLLDPRSVPLRPRSERSLTQTFISIIKGLVLVAIFTILILIFLPVLRKVQKLEAQKDDLAVQIDEDGRVQKRLQQEYELLRSNPEYLERVARDRLNLGKPNEVIFRFDPYDSGKNKPKPLHRP